MTIRSTLQIFYGLVIGMLLFLIAFIIFRHVYVSAARKIYPDSIDAEAKRIQSSITRRNAIAQSTESNHLFGNNVLLLLTIKIIIIKKKKMNPLIYCLFKTKILVF